MLDSYDDETDQVTSYQEILLEELERIELGQFSAPLSLTSLSKGEQLLLEL